jgi:hypothetical protein
MGEKKDKIMNEDEEAEEVTRERGEAQLAPKPTHVGTRRTRKTAPSLERFFRSALSTESLQTEETSEEEETPVFQAPRAKKR